MHPMGIQPSGAGTPDAPQHSEKPRAVGTPRYGPHGVGLTGMSVTSQCLQNRFLGLALLGASGSTSTSTYFLLCERGEEKRTLWARCAGPGACTHGLRARSNPPGVLSAPPIFFYFFFSHAFPRTHTLTVALMQNAQRRRGMNARQGNARATNPLGTS